MGGEKPPDAQGGASSDRARERAARGNGDGRLKDGGQAGPEVSQAGQEDVHGDVADDHRADPRFFIVGVGASAGGLEALSALLKQVKLDDMAFVVVQHLAPKHESFLPALLARVSNIEVEVATDGTQVEPNHVYVIPPNADLAILRGVLHVMTPPQTQPGHAPGTHLPIDYFFRHLAEDLGPRSVGIVLSGTGHDGTFGLKAIKEAGGITFAQDPATAKYDGMPRSAIEAGWADFSLAPEAIADELQHISRHPYLAQGRARSTPDLQEGVGKLLVLMRASFGTDLTYCKPATIERRVERRMARGASAFRLASWMGPRSAPSRIRDRESRPPFAPMSSSGSCGRRTVGGEGAASASTSPRA